jgi:hypothetical protein
MEHAYVKIESSGDSLRATSASATTYPSPSPHQPHLVGGKEAKSTRANSGRRDRLSRRRGREVEVEVDEIEELRRVEVELGERRSEQSWAMQRIEERIEKGEKVRWAR